MGSKSAPLTAPLTRGIVAAPDAANEELMAHDYGREKLYEAVNALVGSDAIQMRLTNATEALSPLALQPDPDLPAELRDRFDALWLALTELPLSDEHDSTPRPVTDEEGAKLAREILSLYTEAMGGL
jgi:hypothetical protein